MIKFGSLFSGIGGFDLGFERAGMECVWQVEIEPNCQKLLGAKFQNAKRYTDVREVGKHNLESVDVVCGGFPCQDLSVAGKRAGLAGERSGLWREFHRIVEEIKPSWVVVENVFGLLSSNSGRDFAVIVRGLVECGYRVAWRILDARYFGVAQRRRRVFIVASLGNGGCAEVLFESEGVSRGSAPGIESQKVIAGTLCSRTKGGGFPGTDESLDGYIQVAQTITSGGNGHRGHQDCVNMTLLPVAKPLTSSNGRIDFETENLIAFNYCMKCSARTQIARTGGNYAQMQATRPDAIAFGYSKSSSQTMKVSETTDALQASPTSNPAILDIGVRRLTPIECERLQGFPDGWTDGFSDSTRYRMLGNAVCVPVANWIGRRLLGV